ncbi:MAG: protein phosphatase 2C domain-containing protein [Henriciella sp.]|uniref:PP2C family protein-serine/threonine phosphatase n=1 Tax=Henriciella sp. TaxID=1968823 RepID=UPI003C789B3E
MNSNVSLSTGRGLADCHSPLNFRSAGRTDRGRVRKLNEDAFLENGPAGLWAVADGMGGHDSGDFASALVIQRLSRIAGADSTYALRTIVARELAGANEALLSESTRKSRGQMGATVAVMAVCNGYYSCTWAGDSRVYLLRRGRLRRITSDHSLVQSLIDAGEISQEEARHHSRAHIVTRAIGAGPELHLETTHGELERGDRFLLCTDGLTSVLSDDEILGLIAASDPECAVEGLVSKTLSNGAPDNVTAVLVDVSAAD